MPFLPITRYYWVDVGTGIISQAASQHITDAAFEAWQSALEDDEDKAAVTVAVEAAASTLTALGSGPCAGHAQKLAEAVTPFLKGESACQVLIQCPILCIHLIFICRLQYLPTYS